MPEDNYTLIDRLIHTDDDDDTNLPVHEFLAAIAEYHRDQMSLSIPGAEETESHWAARLRNQFGIVTPAHRSQLAEMMQRTKSGLERKQFEDIVILAGYVTINGVRFYGKKEAKKRLGVLLG